LAMLAVDPAQRRSDFWKKPLRRDGEGIGGMVIHSDCAVMLAVAERESVARHLRADGVGIGATAGVGTTRGLDG